jgi:hypothetical protein
MWKRPIPSFLNPVSQDLRNKLEDEALLLSFRMPEAYVIDESLLPHLFYMVHYFV